MSIYTLIDIHSLLWGFLGGIIKVRISHIKIERSGIMKKCVKIMLFTFLLFVSFYLGIEVVFADSFPFEGIIMN